MTDAPARILVVEDDPGIRESLTMVLSHERHDVTAVESGELALDHVAGNPADVVVLDINLPGIDGLETCTRLRAGGFTGQVLMLTARHEVADRVAGLDAGADDYLAKPFALDELLARLRVMLRRTAAAATGTPAAAAAAATGSDGRLVLDDLVIDVPARSVTRGGSSIDLTKIEFDLLELLVENAGIVLPRDTIQDRIWGWDDDVASNSMEVFISTLRKKTEQGDRARLIQTVRGVGYVARSAEG